LFLYEGTSDGGDLSVCWIFARATFPNAAGGITEPTITVKASVSEATLFGLGLMMAANF